MQHRIGVLHGREETFPPALILEINARQTEFRAEPASVGGVGTASAANYGTIVDRISNRVPFFRAYLKQQALLGAHCVHDPFWLECVDRAVLAQLCAAADVPCLPSVLLPSKDHPDEVDAEDLANLVYPLPWEEILNYVGLPARLRPLALEASPIGRPIGSLGELWQGYAQSKTNLVVLEGIPESPRTYLCLRAGHETVVMGKDGLVAHPPAQLLADSKRFCELSDLPLVGLEFSPYRGQLAVSDLHLFPNLDWWSLSEAAFARVVGSAADYLLEIARRPHQPRYPGVIRNKSAGRRLAKSGR